jgi:hypothetical protein
MAFDRKLVGLLGVVGLLAVLVIWRWVAGWGLVTVNFVEAPLGKVIAAIERQGRVKVATNAPLDTRVTLQLRNAPVFDALDTLAVRMDGDLRLMYVVAPDRAQTLAGLGALTSSGRPEGWKMFSAGFGGGDFGDSIPDLRKISLKPSPMEDRSLHAMLEQSSQKTGVSFLAPETWNPILGHLPKAGGISQVAGRLAKAAKGQVLEVAVIRVRPPSGDGNSGGMAGRGEWDGTRGGRNRPNPEWMAERAEARIALLPQAEQEEARKDFGEMQKFWSEVRALPEDQRRAKIEEVMSRPEVQDRMEDRMAARDEKRSPDQRANRYKRYLDRKQAAQSAGQ